MSRKESAWSLAGSTWGGAVPTGGTDQGGLFADI